MERYYKKCSTCKNNVKNSGFESSEKCKTCLFSLGYPNYEPESESEKFLRLGEIFNLLYGDTFPKPLRLESTLEENSVIVVFTPTWKGTFTFNGPRDFKLVF